jgi:ribose 5-phosphate isomerase B
MTIAIGSDHAGLELKKHLGAYLTKKGYTLADKGTFSNDSVDYPDFAHQVAASVLSGEAAFGLLVCGSGIGVSIAANRHNGIRAALVTNTELAALSREHNNANVLCLGGRFTAAHHAEMIVDTFLNTNFEGGKHQLRIEKIEL